MVSYYTLPVPKEFDYQQNLAYLMRDSNEVMFQINDQKVRRVIEIDEQLLLVEIENKGCKLRISLLNEIELTEITVKKMLLFVSDFFDLERDLEPFYQLASDDQLLQGIEREFYGLRLIGVPDFFEAIAWGILGQQINLSFAYTLKRRLVETFSQKISYQGSDYWAFPKAEVIAEADQDALIALQISQRKAEYLQEVSRLIARGEISKEFYLALGDAVSVEKALTSIRGIGPWTANYVMMRCFRLGDAFPMADIGLLNALKSRQELPEKPKPQDLLPLKARWGNWCGYATFYLWRLLY